MNDLEGDLRKILNSKAREASISDEPTRAVVARARRRQLGTVITATLAAALLVAGSLIGLRSLLRADPANQRPATPPVLPVAPDGFRPVALPQLSLAYPNDWSLVALQPDRTRDRLLQLANFELGPGFGACEQGWSLPQAGVLLEVRLGALQDPLPPWPTPLGVDPGAARPCDADRLLGASREANGIAYSATGLITADATQADVDLLEQAFETLTFPEAVPQAEDLLGSSNLVLDSADSPVGPVILYAYADLEEVVRERPSYWIGSPALSGADCPGRVRSVAMSRSQTRASRCTSTPGAESSGATCRARRFVPSSAPSRALRSPPIFSRSPRHRTAFTSSSVGHHPRGNRRSGHDPPLRWTGQPAQHVLPGGLACADRFGNRPGGRALGAVPRTHERGDRTRFRLHGWRRRRLLLAATEGRLSAGRVGLGKWRAERHHGARLGGGHPARVRSGFRRADRGRPVSRPGRLARDPADRPGHRAVGRRPRRPARRVRRQRGRTRTRGRRT